MHTFVRSQIREGYLNSQYWREYAVFSVRAGPMEIYPSPCSEIAGDGMGISSQQVKPPPISVLVTVIRPE